MSLLYHLGPYDIPDKLHTFAFFMHLAPNPVFFHITLRFSESDLQII